MGRVRVAGIGFGTSSILFVALVAGHFGLTIPAGIDTLGLVLFVYCVGIAAGPTFFRSFADRGQSSAGPRALVGLGALVVVAGVFTTAAAAWFMNLPGDLAGGLMAGAMTSTPALGAISETATDPGAVAVGFGVAYPIGITAVVLFVQIGLKLNRSNTPIDTSSPQQQTIGHAVVRIGNPGVVGRRPSEVSAIGDDQCQISRVEIEGRWRPVPSQYRFKLDDRVVLVGQNADTGRVAETLGEVIESELPVLDADHERKLVVVTSSEICGKSLSELSFRSRFGVTVARIRRHEFEFVPSSRTYVEFGDVLTLVGESNDLARITSIVGHRPRTMNETDLLSLTFGLAMGVAIGACSVSLGGFSLSLGMAGGPLAVGLVLGHFRRLGPIRGSYPPAAMMLMTEGGLAVFLAGSGTRAGANVVEVLTERGWGLALVATVIVVVPLLVGTLVAWKVLRLPRLSLLGATCGGMTSTPGLAVLTEATDSAVPVTSYVSAYPVALVLMTVVSPMLVRLITMLTGSP
ncbi:Aspartate/alanine antiporter [Rubripirellula lacrimiformis]|uniref:Aspartate/alanine antiporter n=2 Tax=Rubripirellula lacrimiformis TaxID=1930273 RepID=A0A517N9N0_9BACT|nr:Aspartate/alanine antiporter [Rubripirellula lacrimiformis]